MADFLTAAYALRLRKIFQDNKDKITASQSMGTQKSRKLFVKMALPLMKEAFKIGVDFGATWAKIRKQLKTLPERDYKISPKEKNALLKLFIKTMIFAEKAYRLKVEQQKEMQSESKIKRNVTEGGKDLLWAFYIGEIKKAFNVLIAETGATGKNKVLREYYD